jgi:TRAP transporter TAXI family solute receptor
MKKMRGSLIRSLLTVMVVSFFVFSVAGTGFTADWSGIITFGVSSLGSTDQIFVEAMSNIINKYTNIKTATTTASGGVEIMQLMAIGELNAGFAGSLSLVDYQNKSGPFATIDAKPEKMLQMFGFVNWQDPIVVLASSEINSYEDLVGKRVAIPPEGSATNAMIRTVLQAYGIEDKIRLEGLSWQVGFEALKDGSVDGWVANWSTLEPSANLIDLENSRDYTILTWDEEHIKKTNELNPGIFTFNLNHVSSPQNIKEGEEVAVPGFCGVMTITADIPEDVVYELVMAIFNHIDELQATRDSFKYVPDLAMSASMASIPFHPGAARALKELGLWKEGYIIWGEK